MYKNRRQNTRDELFKNKLPLEKSAQNGAQERCREILICELNYGDVEKFTCVTFWERGALNDEFHEG